MKRLTSTTAVILVMGVFAWEGRDGAGGALAASADPHAYFKTLVARSDHWKSFSLRTAGQMLTIANGGYAACGSCSQDITYSPSSDTDPHAQDAAKVVIPAFRAMPGSKLTQALDATENYLHLATVDGSYTYRELKIDGEIVTIPYYIPGTKTSPYNRTDKTVYVIRGQFGTTPKPHPIGSTAMMSVNSIRNLLYLPLFTSDGHSYLFTWDVYHTDSWLNNGLTNLKTFQFSGPSYPSGNQNVVWFQVNNHFTNSALCTYSPGFNGHTDVSTVGARSVNLIGGDADWKLTDGNHIGPGVTTQNPVCPASGQFVVKPNRWTRYWVRVDQRANDYDYLDMWVADESTNATKVLSQVPLSIGTAGTQRNSIHKFWLEFNTSTDGYKRGSERDFVTYVRNFVALRDVTDVDNLLQRPVSTPFVPPPSAPKNLRIVP